MSAHSHVQRLQYLQQQQAAQRQHQMALAQNSGTMASAVSGGGGSVAGSGSHPPSVSGYGQPPQPPPHRYASNSTAGYAPIQHHPMRPGLYSANSQGSLNSVPASVSTYAPRGSAGGTRLYQQTNLKASRSLGASRASLATQKSGKSTIQQENRDRKVRHEVKSPWFGKARVPFMIAVVMYIIAGVLVITGAVITALTVHGRIFLPVDNSMAVGPIILAIGFVFALGGIKFIYDAYKINAIERGKLKFRAHNASMVSINTIGSRKGGDEHEEALMSGGATKNAVTRTPTGSRMSLSHIA